MAPTFASGNTLIVDSASKLYTFTTGDTYWYTDYATGIKLGNKEQGVETDRVIVRVDNTKTKGTKENPYVINSNADWDNFVTFTATAANRSKTYVLNTDLDYKQTNGAKGVIKSVKQFSGTFYGNGHRISNVQYSVANAYNNVLGLFCAISGTSYFSDVIIENLSVTTSGNCSNVGGFVGHSDGNTKFANITVTGSYSGTSLIKQYCPLGGNCAIYPGFGGILHSAGQSGKSTEMYKCATDVECTFTSCSCSYVSSGGLICIYDGYYSNMASLYITDCYSAISSKHVNATNGQTWGGMVGFLRGVNNNYFTRCFSVFNLVSSSSSFSITPGIMATMGQGNKYTGNYYFRNCFGYGSFKMSNTVAKGIPFLGKYSATGTLKESTNTYTFTENASSGSIAASEMSTKAAKTASS